jgi:hypothetical protein
MTTAFKRKTDDNQIVQLNNVGLSLKAISSKLNVHHTTITHRLKAMGIPPADTRRAFMEDIFETLTMQQQDWLIRQLGPGHNVKDFVRSLILKEFINRQAASPR